MRDETLSGVQPDRVIRQLLKAAAAPGSPWMPPTVRPSGSSRTSKTSPSTSPRSLSLLPLDWWMGAVKSGLMGVVGERASSSTLPPTTMTACPHHALRPGRGHSRPILPASSTTTSTQAATLARTCRTWRTRTEMAAAATSSVLSRQRRPRALHRRYPAQALTSWASPWAQIGRAHV